MMKEENSTTKQVFLKVLLVFACVAAILAMNYLLFQMYTAKSLSLQKTYIAARDIPPRTCIEEKDLIEVSIPENYLLDHAYTSKKDIIGRYTEIQGMIPAGSPFYRSMLYDEKDLPDRAAVQLREGQTSFAMNTDVSGLGSITAGMRADLYVTVERRGEAPLSGCLLHNVRILSVKDHKGLEISDPQSSGIPYLVEAAVANEDIQLLTLAQTAGEIRMFPTSQSYRTDIEAELDEGSQITQYLKNLAGT